MAVVPHQGLGGKMANILKTNKKVVTIYSIFTIPILEIASLFLEKLPNYVYFWYPLLTYICLFQLLLSLFLWNDKLRFCYRKNIATLFLAFYYLFGIFALIFQFSANFYYSIVSIGLLILSLTLFVTSIFKTNE